MKTCPEPCDLSYIVCPESFYHSTAQSCFPPDFLPVTAGRKRKVFQLCSYNFMLNVNKRPELCVLVFAFLLLTVLSHLLFYPILSFLLAILLAVWSLHSHSGRSQLGGQAATALLPGSACSPRLGWVPGAAWGQWEHFGGVTAAELQVVFPCLAWNLQPLHPDCHWVSPSSRGICEQRPCPK